MAKSKKPETDLGGTVDVIVTSAEMAENDVLPIVHEVHTDPATKGACPEDLPPSLQVLEEGKSPARWAYERLIIYIQNFEKQLQNDQEIAMGFTGGDAGVIRIEGLGYFDPDILTFYGSNEVGAKTQLVQHVSQLNVLLTALPIVTESAKPNRIGFRLARELDGTADTTT